MKHIKLLLALSLAVLMLNGFWSGKSDRELKREKKAENFQARVQRMYKSKEILKDLYVYSPEAQNMVAKSYGYATFTNIGVSLVFFSAEGGKGVAHNNHNGRNTFMNMGSAGLGLGLGGKEFSIIFLFESKKVYKRFIKSGWEANAQSDAAAKYNTKGGALSAAVTVAPGIRMYKITKNGLMLQASVLGTKYWQDGDLN